LVLFLPLPNPYLTFDPRSHLEVLKEVTNDVHYENFRQESLSKGVDT